MNAREPLVQYAALRNDSCRYPLRVRAFIFGEPHDALSRAISTPSTGNEMKRHVLPFGEEDGLPHPPLERSRWLVFAPALSEGTTCAVYVQRFWATPRFIEPKTFQNRDLPFDQAD